MIFGPFDARRHRPCAKCKQPATVADSPSTTTPPAGGSSYPFPIPPSVAIVVVAVFGAVGWLLWLGLAPQAAVVTVGGTGAVAIELVRRLAGRDPEER